jgi:hypothetical protein
VPVNFVRLRIGWLYKQRCVYLFASLLLLLGLVPFFIGTQEGRIVGNVLNVVVLVAAVAAVGRTKLSFVITLLLALPTLAFQLAWLTLGEVEYQIRGWGFSAAVYVATLAYLLRYVFRDDVMNADKLYGAAAAYLLLGIIWAYLYGILQHFNAGAFALNGTPVAAVAPQDLVYFSFTVLTTTGFGDFTPVLPHARSLVNLEQICGVLYVAILIARLAGMNPPGEKSSR